MKPGFRGRDVVISDDPDGSIENWILHTPDGRVRICHTLRNPVAYAIELCSRIKSGAFHPVGPPLAAKPAENSRAETARPSESVLRSRLSSELSGLKRLRTAGRQDASAALLDRQIADLEARLSGLQEAGR